MLVALLGQNVWAQTLAAPVRSVLKDTAIQSSDLYGSRDNSSYTSLASGVEGAIQDPSLGDGIRLGPTDEGTIISISEGEDRIVSETRPGDFVSTNASQYMGSSIGYEPSTHMSGGSYSGYGSSYGYSGGNPCCPENCHSYYTMYEGLFFRRKADENFTLSRGRFLDTFDYEYGHRITLGQMLDCTDGVEIVYTGPLKWQRARADQSNSGNLNSVLTAGGGYIDSQIDTFNGAIRHIQVEENDLQSYEANRRWFAWDIMSTLIGFRAIQYNESFLFDSVDQDLGAGFLRTRIENFLLGGQIGADVYRPIGQRLSIGTRSRLGLFGNFNRGETLIANRGSYLIFARDRDIDFAAVFQSGISARYRISRRMAAVTGYEAWALTRMGTVSDQVYSPVTPNTGLSYQTRDTVFLHGGTAGLEITW